LIKEAQYRKFSLKTHQANNYHNSPSLAQLELTSACPYNCSYCYMSGYSQGKPGRELSLAQWRKIIADLKASGVLWLTFTGGDPLVRKDFCDIYRYASSQGFIIMVFTSGFLLTRKHFELFKKYPPFYIEVTVNAVRQDLYEKISGVAGSFAKVTAALNTLKTFGVPLRIKTQATTLNRREIPLVKKYARKLKASWQCDYFLHPTLAGTQRILDVRIKPGQIPHNEIQACAYDKTKKSYDQALFTCAAPRGDAFSLDPYGDMFLCSILREDKVNILETGLMAGLSTLKGKYARLEFKSDSPCKICQSRDECSWCPGKAFLETGSLEKPIKYCCELTGIR
jgi:MoaA/NifB/PqqE/SkfB family radical SAM enzyme